MHVQHPLRPGPLMQVIDILRDDQQFPWPRGIQSGERIMRRVGLYRPEFRAPLVIETVHQVGIAPQRFGRTDILDMMSLP